MYDLFVGYPFIDLLTVSETFMWIKKVLGGTEMKLCMKLHTTRNFLRNTFVSKLSGSCHKVSFLWSTKL